MTGLAQWRSGYFSTAPTIPGKSVAALRELAAAELNSTGSPMLQARAARYRRRLQEGHALFAMTDEGRIVGYLWASDAGKEVPLGLGVSFIVPDSMAYIWDCRTDPDHQGRGLYRRGLEALRRRFAGRCGCCLIAVERDNLAAIRAMRAAGFEDRRLSYRLARLGPFGLYVKGGVLQPFLRAYRDSDLLSSVLQARSGFSTTKT